MNILIDINHPAHVHLLRNTYKSLIQYGHNVYVTVKDIPSAIELLDLYGIPYYNIGHKYDTLWLKGLDQLLYDWRILKMVILKHIQIGIGSSINIAHVSRLTAMSSIILDDDDDEVEPLFVRYAHPFADIILSPKGTPRKSKKVLFVPSYHELNYLHPSWFKPDKSILDEVGIHYKEDTNGGIYPERFFVLRFNAFKAHHDIGVQGLSYENKQRLVRKLSAQGKVFITTERNIEDEFIPYQLKISPDKAHSLLYYATMFVGDSQTMTSEAAVLGTPSIRCNSFVRRIHYLEDEEYSYGLTYGFLPQDADMMFNKIEDILNEPDVKREWQTRRYKMLSEKIDYAKFLTWFIENYPQSAQDTKAKANDSNFWKQFK